MNFEDIEQRGFRIIKEKYRDGIFMMRLVQFENLIDALKKVAEKQEINLSDIPKIEELREKVPFGMIAFEEVLREMG